MIFDKYGEEIEKIKILNDLTIKKIHELNDKFTKKIENIQKQMEDNDKTLNTNQNNRTEKFEKDINYFYIKILSVLCIIIVFSVIFSIYFINQITFITNQINYLQIILSLFGFIGILILCIYILVLLIRKKPKLFPSNISLNSITDLHTDLDLEIRKGYYALIKDGEGLVEIDKKVPYLRESVNYEVNRANVLAKILTTLKTINVELSSDTLYALYNLKDTGEPNKLIINRLKMVNRELDIPFQVLDFLIELFQARKKIIQIKWIELKTDLELIKNFIKLTSKCFLFQNVKLDVDLQCQVLQKLNEFDLNKYRLILNFAEVTIEEFNRIQNFLIKEGFNINIDKYEMINKLDFTSFSELNLELIDKLINLNLVNIKELNSLCLAILVIYIDRYHPKLSKEANQLAAKEPASVEILFLWIKHNEERLYGESLNQVYKKWLTLAESKKLIIPLDVMDYFNYFRKELKQGNFLKDIQIVFEKNLIDREYDAEKAIERLKGEIINPRHQLEEIIPSFVFKKITLSTIIRLVKMKKKLIYLINFKPAGEGVANILNGSIREVLKTKGLSANWENFTTASRVGVIEGENFYQFKDELEKEIKKYSELNESNIFLTVFFPSEDLTLECGNIQLKNIIKRIMGEDFESDLTEITATLDPEYYSITFKDLLIETLDNYALEPFLDDKTREELPDEIIEKLKQPQLTTSLIRECNCSALADLIIAINLQSENYIKILFNFFKSRKIFNSYYQKISECLISNFSFIKKEYLDKSQNFSDVLKKFHQKFENMKSNIKEAWIKNLRLFFKILMYLIEYQDKISKFEYRNTCKFENEYDFGDHFYEFFSRIERFGPDIIIIEPQSGPGKIDFLISNIPVELKFYNNNRQKQYKSYKLFEDEKKMETKQYTINFYSKIGIMVTMDILEQNARVEADKLSYFELDLISGGIGVKEDEDENPTAIIKVHILGGIKTDVSKIKKLEY